ncbi:DNA-directed RNA polymerase subunit B'' [Candidatus Micrarchaeota archaeon CG08_land_8_20_14_0_20_49_17]|nr:MAG: DNA-directed RNA polymerase subunit B'' [Candidatus Micrarchaeota archaeon CG08_land_8_20_14_0_20_49_17]
MAGRELMELYLRENSLVRQHFDSYNKFIDFGLQEAIDRVGLIKPPVEGFELKLDRVRLDKPTIIEADGSRRYLKPSECRLRNLTYAAPLFLELIPIFNGVEKRMHAEVYIGEMPIMVKSKNCHLHGMTDDELIEAGEDPSDPGGNFIINGSERVLISIEDLAPNKIITTREKDDVIAKVFSTRHGFRARCVVSRDKAGVLHLTFPASTRDLPLIPILKILGIETDRQIIDMFAGASETVRNDILLNLEVDETTSRDEALDFIGRRVAPGQPIEFRIKRVEHILDNYLLPHISLVPDKRLEKSVYLCTMAERAILVASGELNNDDKDHYGNKRIRLAGDLMDELFRYALQFLVKDISYQASRADARGRKLVVQTLVRPDALTDRIRYAMATGNWIAGQTGVSQLLDRTSYLSTLSHLRRVISPLNRRHPHFEARDLHGTHWGKICPDETPEGPSCSLVKNMALLSAISIGCDENEMSEVVKCMGVSLAKNPSKIKIEK